MKNIIILFSTILLFLISQQSFATVHTILVGQSGLTFSPSSITTVLVGDTIRWSWVSGNHTSTSVTIPSGATSWDNFMASSASNFDYKVTVPGTYDYKCNPHAGAGMKGTFLAQQIIEGVQKGGVIYSSMTVFPNPTTDQIQLTFNSDQSFSGSLLIYDASGNLDKEEKMRVKSGENIVVVNVSRLSNGVHVLNLLNGETALVAKRFIKE